MDLERALDVMAKFVAEGTQTRAVDQLQQVFSLLQQPSNPTNDENLKKHLKEFIQALDNADSNGWAPSQRRLLEQLHLANATGIGLRSRLEEILRADSLTRAVAAHGINQLLDIVRGAHGAAAQVTNGFKTLTIVGRPAPVEECELAILIPASAPNKDTLESLDADLEGFDQLLKTINEIVGEPGVSPRISGLASGSWQIYLELGIRATDILVKAISSIVALRRKVAEVRKTSDKLKVDNASLPVQIVEQLQTFAKSMTEEGLGEISIEIVNKSVTIDEGRRNELTNAVSMRVNFLAKKLDEGVRVEVNPPKELPAAAQQNKRPEDIQQLQRTLDEIKVVAPAIAKMEDAETPMLLLSSEHERPAERTPNV